MLTRRVGGRLERNRRNLDRKLPPRRSGQHQQSAGGSRGRRRRIVSVHRRLAQFSPFTAEQGTVPSLSLLIRSPQPSKRSEQYATAIKPIAARIVLIRSAKLCGGGGGIDGGDGIAGGAADNAEAGSRAGAEAGAKASDDPSPIAGVGGTGTDEYSGKDGEVSRPAGTEANGWRGCTDGRGDG